MISIQSCMLSWCTLSSCALPHALLHSFFCFPISSPFYPSLLIIFFYSQYAILLPTPILPFSLSAPSCQRPLSHSPPQSTLLSTPSFAFQQTSPNRKVVKTQYTQCLVYNQHTHTQITLNFILDSLAVAS